MAAVQSTSKIRKPSFVEVQGVLAPWNCDVSHVLFAIMYRPYPGDVIVASYPRCGGIWVSLLLYMLTHDAKQPEDQKAFFQDCLFLEELGRKVEDVAPPRKLQTHLPAKKLRLSPAAKYIYVVRSYKDCCVSLYDFMITKAADYRFKDGTFDEYFQSFIDGTMENNDYFDHLVSWWAHKNDPNFFFVLLENLKNNFEKCVVEMAEFLEGRAARLVRDAEKLKRIVDLGTFDCSKLERDRGLDFLKEGDCFMNCVSCVDEYWKARLTEKQSESLDLKFYEKTMGTPLEELFRKSF
ncbi:hypothetical protein HPB47_025282 [Ixodes persulcatus]|uniref:Uncharacterized protein n=1 Tax=Ixodes persulcatus TaxID=34615 RepID=A0AC60Q1Z9_IXOPE|nr:hypothetical protein HPB47_025282 [Ixodes persulcatus]